MPSPSALPPVAGPAAGADAPPTGGAVPGSPYRVVFVCTGNICRSPMAEVVLRRLAADYPLPEGGVLGDRLVVTSAGTGNWHVGETLDPRARDALATRGYDGEGHVVRQFRAAWLGEEDLVVCLDRSHRHTVAGLGRGRSGDDRHETSIVLLRPFDPAAGGAVDVDDPYYGDDADFARCLAEVEAACRGLVVHLAEAVDGGPAAAGSAP